MVFSNIIPLIKLLFAKDKELYVYIYTTTGRYPRDIKLYELAFVHSSLSKQTTDGKWINNERLEYLGDAILDAVVADYLYKLYPDRNEGFLTAMRAKIVQRESLNRIGRVMHIEQHVKASAHSSSHNSYICGNALEAMVGAMYLDHGYSACKKFIEKRIIAGNFNLDELVNTDQNYKSRLIEWTQKYRVSIEFELVDTFVDKDNNPIFKTAILLGGIYTSDATGYSKKESHQGASKNAIERLKTDNQLREQVLATATAPPTVNAEMPF